MKLKQTALLFLLATGSSNAALTLMNGNFEAAGTSLNDVGQFFESSTAAANYNEYVTETATHFSTNGTAKLQFSSGGNYVYQSLGAYVDEATIAINGQSLVRDSIGRSTADLGPVTFDIYQTPDTTTGADGTNVSGLTGASLLGSVTVDLTALSYTGDTASFSTGPIAITSATSGNLIWFGITDGSGGAGSPESILDNLSITTTAVPEPSSTALLGLGGLTLLLRRRK